jgi:hypothetical protein
MAFDANGRWQGERPNQPVGWRTVPATTLHHMIDWAALGDFWNRLITDGRPADITRYLEIAGFEGNPRHILAEIQAARMHQFRATDLVAHDNLAAAICWQRYNLFEGPPWQYRPVHSPAPEVILRHFADLGATTFDFPIVVPPHGFRANTLYRAFLQMTAFIDSGAAGPLAECLRLLAEVCHLDVIPAYDVNWFALPKASFLALTPLQRQQFFQACFRHGWNSTAAQVDQAHAQVTSR